MRLDRRRLPALRFLEHDLRDGGAPPLAPDPAAPPFDLVLCRNLAFTYFGDPLQRRTLERLRAVLRPGGCLVLGSHEQLPQGASGFAAWAPHPPLCLYRRLP